MMPFNIFAGITSQASDKLLIDALEVETYLDVDVIQELNSADLTINTKQVSSSFDYSVIQKLLNPLLLTAIELESSSPIVPESILIPEIVLVATSFNLNSIINSTNNLRIVLNRNSTRIDYSSNTIIYESNRSNQTPINTKSLKNFHVIKSSNNFGIPIQVINNSTNPACAKLANNSSFLINTITFNKSFNKANDSFISDAIVNCKNIAMSPKTANFI